MNFSWVHEALGSVKEHGRKRAVAFHARWGRTEHCENIMLAGLYAFAIGIFGWAIQRLLTIHSAQIYLQWTAGFRPDTPSYNAPFVIYILALAAVIGLFFLHHLLGFMPAVRSGLVKVGRAVFPVAFGLVLCLLLVAPAFSQLLFVVAALCLGWCFFTPDFAGVVMLSPWTRGLFKVSIVILLGLSLWLGAKSWYPFTLPNDYVEIADTLLVPQSNVTQPLQLSRIEALDCLTAVDVAPAADELGKIYRLSSHEEHIAAMLGNQGGVDASLFKRLFTDAHRVELLTQPASHPCRYGLTQHDMDPLRQPLIAMSDWQSNSGRTLYHHSYIYVPAVHFLRYGLQAPVPYLYGLGNTLLHAALMAGDPTLTRYFNTFPIAQLIGVLAIVLLVFYITRSRLAVVAGVAATLTPFWMIGADAVHMAGGFSPARYVGLALQVASIFAVSRAPGRGRILLAVGAFALSLLWNKEFAILGLSGQLLILVDPRINLRPALRFGGIAALLLAAFATMPFLDRLSTGFVETIQVGIYGVALPAPQDMGAFVIFCSQVSVAALALFWCARRFESTEGAARFSLLPIMGLLLIKYVYNVSYAHLSYSFVFVAPLLLVFWDWKTHNLLPARLREPQKKDLVLFAVLMGTLFCCLFAVRYYSGSRMREALQINDFAPHNWKRLGESLTTTIPEESIADRIDSLRGEVKPDDAVLFLSPFDHLLSFYINPRHYCGHFEVLTNLVTFKTVDEVADCVRHNPHALVVYDTALAEQCPENWPYILYYNPETCALKKKMKQTLASLMAGLIPDLVLVKQQGGLSYYRPASFVESKRHEP